MTKPMTQRLRICRQCPIHHYENCNSCFGFGVYEGHSGQRPVRAGDAIYGQLPGQVHPCPECGSTETGAPPSLLSTAWQTILYCLARAYCWVLEQIVVILDLRMP